MARRFRVGYQIDPQPPADSYARKNAILDEWCAGEGRDPRAIERTVSTNDDSVGDHGALRESGAQHLIVPGAQPFDMAPLERLIARAEASTQWSAADWIWSNARAMRP
jgi:hypothetical protein